MFLKLNRSHNLDRSRGPDFCQVWSNSRRFVPLVILIYSMRNLLRRLRDRLREGLKSHHNVWRTSLERTVPTGWPATICTRARRSGGGLCPCDFGMPLPSMAKMSPGLTTSPGVLTISKSWARSGIAHTHTLMLRPRLRMRGAHTYRPHPRTCPDCNFVRNPYNQKC